MSQHHIIPLKIYLGTFLALLFLTGLTVALARVDLGSLNIFIAMLIACVKASLVGLFFMGLRYDRKLNINAFLIGLFFLGIFFVLIFCDILTRGEIDPQRDYPESVQYQPFH
jgi:cytochrome c oxidase subunit 4